MLTLLTQRTYVATRGRTTTEAPAEFIRRAQKVIHLKSAIVQGLDVSETLQKELRSLLDDMLTAFNGPVEPETVKKLFREIANNRRFISDDPASLFLDPAYIPLVIMRELMSVHRIRMPHRDPAWMKFTARYGELLLAI